MEYTQKFNELKSVFNPDSDVITIPGSEIRIINVKFICDTGTNDIFNKEDIVFSENTAFTYPVFIPSDTRSKKVILLLHGLNERSWIKYLVWAYYLSLYTDSYVILFPISFHMNRSPESWKDPRAMMKFLNERRMAYGKIDMASIANIALSNRLTEDPRRFFSSGYQTVLDIVKLLKLIKSGKHQVVPEESKVNVFAYSIGAFLAQIIFMGNPEGLFTNSKLFMFCGGSVFSNMYGTSKLIMDNLAYEKVYSYYMNDFENETRGKNQLVEFLKSSRLGMAFRSMIDFSRLKKFRENALKELRDQTHAIALLKDIVIPPKGIMETLNNNILGNSQPVELWDFPYPYSHENPFPVFDSDMRQAVDNSFERVFSAAVAFLK